MQLRYAGFFVGMHFSHGSYAIIALLYRVICGILFLQRGERIMQITIMQTEYYIEGIKEGRRLLTDNPGINKQEALESCKRLLAQGFTGGVRDMFRGERDFWELQIKKEGSRG